MRWRIVQNGNTWSVIRPDGSVDSADHPSYQAALAHLPRPAFALHALALAEDPGAPVVAEEGEAPENEAQPFRAWASDAAFLNQWTAEGWSRRLSGTVRFRPGVMPLMYQDETEMGHFGARLVGWIDNGTTADDTIRMAGYFDNSEDADEAVAAIEARGSIGVSVDVGDVEEVASVCIGVNEDNECTEYGDDFVNPEMIGLTITPFPAFQNAQLWLGGFDARPAPLPAPEQPEEHPDAEQPEPMLLLLASGATFSVPDAPPAEWFADPGIGDLAHPLMQFSDDGCALGVPLQITDDGRVFGHLAAWGTCHIGMEGCTTPPGSPSNYAYFRTGYVVADDGQQVPTGVLTMGTGHADLNLSARETVAHYDDSRYGFADVAAGEDAVGIWIAGAIRPGTTEEQVRMARALSPSGDWRSIGGALELVASLMVNVPGFPVPRSLAASAAVRTLPTVDGARARVVAGATVAMVASGVVARRQDRTEALTRRVAALELRLASLDSRTTPLLASAKQAVVDRVRR